MNTTEILIQQLYILIEDLRFAGYKIGIAQLMAAQDLILALAAQGKLLSISDLARLETLLAPILCHSPQEQINFKQHFNKWMNQLEIEVEKKKVPLWKWFLWVKTTIKNASLWEWFITAKEALLWKRLFASIAIAFLVAIYLYTFSPYFISEPTKISQIPPASKVDSTETPSQSTNTIFETMGSTDEETSNKTPDKPTSIWSSFLEEPRKTIVSLTVRQVTFLGFALLLFLLPLFFLLWKLWQRKLFLTRKLTSRLPDQQIPIKDISKDLFQSIGLGHLAQQLRKHIDMSSHQLDMTSTINKTAQAAGWFTPVTGTMKSLPEYLVLIDRASLQDHQTQLIKTFTNRLIDEKVIITRYYFDSDPRACYPEQPQLVPLTLEELAKHYPAHRLMIFSDGDGFVNPITGEEASWIQQFSQWQYRVFLSLEALIHLRSRQQILENAGFVVVPANEMGLTMLAEQIQVETWQADSNPPDSLPPFFPEHLKERPLRWLERHAPDADLFTEMLTQVKDFLGETGYYWLSACAVYPEVHWKLTIQLGYQLISKNSNELEPHLGQLTRLPWFRHSYMPDWLRAKLIKDLSFQQRKKIQHALNNILQTTSNNSLENFILGIIPDKPRLPEKNQDAENIEHVLITSQKEPLRFKIINKFKNKLQQLRILPVSSKITPKIFGHFIGWFVAGILLFIPLFFQYKLFSSPDILGSLPVRWLIIGFLILTVVFFWYKLFNWLVPRFSSHGYLILRRLAANLGIGIIMILLLNSFQNYPPFMNIENTSLYFAMQVRQIQNPPVAEKQIPPFVFLDIDDQTHRVWGEPMFTPRNKTKELIEIAVKSGARLVIVNIDLSRKTPLVGLPLPKEFQMHPYDQVLYDYIAHYKKDYCQTPTKCPPIILTRTFRPFLESLVVKEQKKVWDYFPPMPEPIYEARISFLETAVAQSTPYVQWASSLFWRSSYDNVIRRWKLWESICTNGQPEVIPSIELLAAAIIRHETPQQAQETVTNALQQFKPKSCNDNHMPQPVSPQVVEIADVIRVTDNMPGIYQRIIYNMPWRSPDEADGWAIRYSLSDYEGKVILTVLSAQPYLELLPTIGSKLEFLKDEIVVIGGSHTYGRDIHSTPLGEMPGGLILINAIHSLLQYGEIQPLSTWHKLLFIIMLVIFMTIVLTIMNSFWGIVFSGMCIILSLVPFSIFLLNHGIWVNIILPSIVVLLYHIAADFNEMSEKLDFIQKN